MPKDSFSFGVMSTPGACATELTTEVQHAVVPRTPDVVCLLAPSNNLTSSRTPDEAGADFCRLLGNVCGRWPNKVFVLDFPPRLTVDVTQQDYLRQEFHRVSARMGVKYMSTAAFFPLKNLKLWSKDGVHLSDDHGMSILVQLMCDGVHQQLDLQTPKLEIQVASRPPAVKTIPKIVVKGETLVLRRLNPFEWIVVGPGRKVMVAYCNSLVVVVVFSVVIYLFYIRFSKVEQSKGQYRLINKNDDVCHCRGGKQDLNNPVMGFPKRGKFSLTLVSWFGSQPCCALVFSACNEGGVPQLRTCSAFAIRIIKGLRPATASCRIIICSPLCPSVLRVLQFGKVFESAVVLS
ncbi:uncharacterized protein LOC144033722 [Festucalex cinctus]